MKITPKHSFSTASIALQANTSKIRKTSSKNLVKCIKEHFKNKATHTPETWDFINRVFAELHIRKYGKTHAKSLLALRHRIEKISHTRFVNEKYSIETVGIKKSDLNHHTKSKKIVHPYPLSKITKEISRKWTKSKTHEPLDAYIAQRLDHKKKRNLLNHCVKYMDEAKRKEHIVTFDEGKISIGGKTPRDGTYIFSLSNDQQTLLATKKYRGKVHHTSLVGGNAVASAGVLYIKHHKLSSLRLSSGHYKPEKESGKILRTFFENILGTTQAAKLRIQPHK